MSEPVAPEFRGPLLGPPPGANPPAPEPAPRAEPPPERRGTGPTLETELSLAVALVASCLGLAYFIYDMVHTMGCDAVGELSFWSMLNAVLQTFALALILYIIQRGVWMAAMSYARNDPQRWGPDVAGAAEFRSSMTGLEARCRATFFAAFHYLAQGFAFLIGWLGFCTLREAENPVTVTFGTVLLVTYVVHAFLSFPRVFSFLSIARRWDSAYRARLDRLMRALGLWWVRTPEGALSYGSWRFSISSVLVTFVMYTSNMAYAIEPIVTLDKAIYQSGIDQLALVEVNHGGVRGAAGNHVKSFLTVDHKLTVPVRQVAVNRHVAAIPLAGLAPGMHEVQIRPMLQTDPEATSAATYIEWPLEIRRSFLLAPPALPSPR